MKTIRNFSFILVTLSSLTFGSSCKKNDDNGKAELHAMIYHGSTPIPSSTLYVKFNATSEPSSPTTNYDLKLQGMDDDNHVHIENLRPGDYYLYAIGYDTLTKQTVKGGAAANIKWSERKKLKEVDIQVN